MRADCLLAFRSRGKSGHQLIIISRGAQGGPPARPPGGLILASVDVEWTKNYRVRNGNVPFCYSVTWVALPAPGVPVSLAETGFTCTSAYVEGTAETGDLIASADGALAEVIEHADLVVGHQLCSDLAVLGHAAGRPPPAVTALRAAWHQRGPAAGGGPRVVDTRYDIGHVLSGTSRRLVDVCADLGLDVTQPELRGTSMTALHRRWTEAGDTAAREKISVLNLRHSLSTALAALRASGADRREGGLNVNRMLADGLGDAFAWTASPAFTALLGAPR